MLYASVDLCFLKRVVRNSAVYKRLIFIAAMAPLQFLCSLLLLHLGYYYFFFYFCFMRLFFFFAVEPAHETPILLFPATALSCNFTWLEAGPFNMCVLRWQFFYNVT